VGGRCLSAAEVEVVEEVGAAAAKFTELRMASKLLSPSDMSTAGEN
jgi:hypothetical protein